MFMFFSCLKNVSGVIKQTEKDNNTCLQYFAEAYFILFLEGVKETSDAKSSLVE
jgi:hypothetical protein